jgi:hypothetical protein
VIGPGNANESLIDDVMPETVVDTGAFRLEGVIADIMNRIAVDIRAGATGVFNAGEPV